MSADTCEWSVSLVEDEDGPMIIRLNESASDWTAHPDLPIKLGFAIPLRNPNPGALPSPEENELLNDVEDAVQAAVEKRTIGINTVTITHGVMKEFLFYIPKDVDIKSLHESLQKSISTHEVQCIAESEAKWPTYRNFQRILAMTS